MSVKSLKNYFLTPIDLGLTMKSYENKKAPVKTEAFVVDVTSNNSNRLIDDIFTAKQMLLS